MIPKLTQSTVSSLHRLFHAKQAVPLAGQLKVRAIRIPIGYGRYHDVLPQTLQAVSRETDFHVTALIFSQITFQIIQLPVKSCAVLQEARYFTVTTMQMPHWQIPDSSLTQQDTGKPGHCKSTLKNYKIRIYLFRKAVVSKDATQSQ